MATARSASVAALAPAISLVDTTACLRADEHAQAEIVAFRALGFLDRAVAHFDDERHRAHGDRVGVVGAGLARGAHQAFGEVSQGGLIEERGH